MIFLMLRLCPTGSHHVDITVVLPFIRTVNNQQERNSPTPSDETRGPIHITGMCRIQWDLRANIDQLELDTEQTIDTQAPLVLSGMYEYRNLLHVYRTDACPDQKILLQDLLAIHMVRNTEENIIISYHHNSEFQKTTAKRLQSLVQRTGDSVYWQKIYEKSKDPTFVFLAILWYALYAWDEALEVLYAHLSEQLVRERFLDVYSCLDGSRRNPSTLARRHTSSTRENCTSCKHIFCTINNFSATSLNRSSSCEILPTRLWTASRSLMLIERTRSSYWTRNPTPCCVKSIGWRNRGKYNQIV